jgi:hypothetical protein
MIARAGPGAAAYPRGSQTWNGTRPALIANPVSSSTSAVVRTAPSGTDANEASERECALATRSSRPIRSAVPLTFPNTTVTRAAPTRSGSRRDAPASR